MDKSAFSSPQVDALISALGESGMDLGPDTLEAVRSRLDALLFQRPGWWGAWQASAMSGRELRDALLQHAQLTIEHFTNGKVPLVHLSRLEKPFELVLFGAPLADDEPVNCDDYAG